MNLNSKDPVAALYIHIPFCKEECIYCTFFTVRVNQNSGKQEIFKRFIQLLKKEIDLYSHDLKFNIFQSMFIGGGNPSLMPANFWVELFDYLKKAFQFKKDAEITIEVHPSSLTKENLKVYKAIGINRLSMRCETFNNPLLKKINQIISESELILKYQWSRDLGFKNINLDIIFNLWNQDEKLYTYNLKKIINMNPDHIYWHGVMSNKKIINSKNMLMPNEDFYQKIYFHTLNLLEKADYNHYEISNFSKPGKQCKHNEYYWTQKNYLGLGPSAVGTINNVRYKNIKNIFFYEKKLNNNIKPIGNIEKLNAKIQNQEKIILGLRRKKGIDIHNIPSYFNDIHFQNKIKAFEKSNFLKIENHYIKMTNLGFMIYDYIMSELI